MGISYVFWPLAVFPAMSITYNDHKCLLLIDRHYFSEDFEDDDGDTCGEDNEVRIAIRHLHRLVFFIRWKGCSVLCTCMIAGQYMGTDTAVQSIKCEIYQ